MLLTVLVLGKTNKDKGTQLEQIAQAMLSAKGFQNIELNSVGTGGAEYDVTADWGGVGVANPVTINVVGECKARKDPVNMDDWQKFLGKVYIESQKAGHEMLGLFITTSGVNTNVAASYRELRRQGKHLELVREIEIESFLRKEYGVCSLQQATGSVAKLTKRTLTSIELCYHSRNCYWLITFEKGTYALLDVAGHPLQGEQLKLIRHLINQATSLKRFIDLYEEKEAQRRNQWAQKHVIARLMLYNGAISETDLLKDSDFTAEEIRTATTTLAKRNWLEVISDGACFTAVDEEGRYEYFIDVIKFWLTEEIKYETLLEGIRSAFYDRHIDEKMLQEVLKIQGNLPLHDEERQGVIRLLKLSPSALLRALHPYPMITTGRNEGDLRSDERVNETDRDLFYEYLSPCLVIDFRTPQIARHFWERGIWELEYRQNIIVKNNQGIMFETKSRSRHTIHPANAQGGFLHFGVISAEPEPWEEAKSRSKKNPIQTRVRKRPAKKGAHKRA
jgi:hypothetical protein